MENKQKKTNGRTGEQEQNMNYTRKAANFTHAETEALKKKIQNKERDKLKQKKPKKTEREQNNKQKPKGIKKIAEEGKNIAP